MLYDDTAGRSYKVPTIDAQMWQDMGWQNHRMNCRVPGCRFKASLSWCIEIGHAEVHCPGHMRYTTQELP